MTFGTNIKNMIDFVYGDVKIDEHEIAKLDEIILVDDDDEDYVKAKAINSLFKNVSFHLLKELNELERKFGSKLRIRHINDFKQNDNAVLDFDKVSLSLENKTIGMNNLKLKTLIDKMKKQNTC